jgi:replicative DNA helicase
MSPKAPFAVAADVLTGWRADVLTGKVPVLYPLGVGQLAHIEAGPGLVTLIGGAPGAGKTALTMQLVVDALRLTPTLRALVCNVEMSPPVLLDRQLARLTGVDLTTIRYRKIGAEHADRIADGMATLGAVADRLCFVRPPFDLGNVAAAADEFGAGLLVLDYIQRIDTPGVETEARQRLNKLMDNLRQFADEGVAILVVSAVTRSKDAKGRSSYGGDTLNLASFRESSELEFGADDAFILHPEDDYADGILVKLKHLKSRHSACRTLTLRFDRAQQRFSEIEPTTTAHEGRVGVTASLQHRWNRTPAADDGQDDE